MTPEQISHQMVSLLAQMGLRTDELNEQLDTARKHWNEVADVIVKEAKGAQIPLVGSVSAVTVLNTLLAELRNQNKSLALQLSGADSEITRLNDEVTALRFAAETTKADDSGEPSAGDVNKIGPVPIVDFSDYQERDL